VFLLAGLLLALSLISYHPFDPSWNTATGAVRPQNLIGRGGSFAADFCFQTFGLAALALPLLAWLMAWKWLRSELISAPAVRVLGSVMLVSSVCAGFALGVSWRPWEGAFACGGVFGGLLAEWLTGLVNPMGAMLIIGLTLILSLYLVSTFSVFTLRRWFAGPIARLGRAHDRWTAWRQRRKEAAAARAEDKRAAREEERTRRLAARQAARQRRAGMVELPAEPASAAPAPEEARPRRQRSEDPEETLSPVSEFDRAPWEESDPPQEEETIADIPIHVIEDDRPGQETAEQDSEVEPAAPDPEPSGNGNRKPAPVTALRHADYHLPPTTLLNDIPLRSPFDSEELKEIAGRIKSKFEEFSVRGSVVQINPGPVVTTFEFKPEAGIKYSKITSLSEDLCLGLQAESILIERIPGKPTIGIEVPNTRRELISLRQILESEEFGNSPSRLTICLGKDISGRIKVAALEGMPHLLIAGSTGAGKSVMLNSMIMSILYKATPDEVRMIMVDPKRVELGIYEGIPHLLTPVITDAKKATYALKNAVLEMERRLKLLASHGVRNIDQFNRKMRQLQQQPRSLFEEDSEPEEETRPLPYILILIDELADLMMLERANVEEAVTRLAQMARAVGMHLVLATQRPSVDVITGLIKANFPSRISFRVATRVDSRTVLDVMGAEHLLGKGDMLFLPPGSSRLTRVHGAFVTEAETNSVVEFWKTQARPEYDQTFLMAPPSEEGEEEVSEEFDGTQDPLYQDAVRVVLEMGKASTSTLQRRLRLGYGRAARILDMMQRDGIIGPPDGSKPREVLKRPDWLEEVETGMR
jgi:S-DNA-T family DNA segregation ATPase FtsK/SpoIIIE